MNYFPYQTKFFHNRGTNFQRKKLFFLKRQTIFHNRQTMFHYRQTFFNNRQLFPIIDKLFSIKDNILSMTDNFFYINDKPFSIIEKLSRFQWGQKGHIKAIREVFHWGGGGTWGVLKQNSLLFMTHSLSFFSPSILLEAEEKEKGGSGTLVSSL